MDLKEHIARKPDSSSIEVGGRFSLVPLLIGLLDVVQVDLLLLSYKQKASLLYKGNWQVNNDRGNELASLSKMQCSSDSLTLEQDKLIYRHLLAVDLERV